MFDRIGVKRRHVLWTFSALVLVVGLLAPVAGADHFAPVVVQGQVTRADGTPVAGARVVVGPAAAQTDADGGYSLSVPGDAHALRIAEPGVGYPFLGFGDDTVDLQSGIETLDLTVPDVIEVRVEVRDATGSPVAAVPVEVRAPARGFPVAPGVSLEGFPQLLAVSDADGAVVFETYALTDASVVVDGIERLSVGDVTDPATIEVVLPEQGEASGVVRSADGSPAPGVRVEAGGRVAETGVDGQYTLVVDRAVHDLGVFHPAGWSLHAAGGLDLTSADADLDLILPLTFAHELIVEFDDGTPVPDADVELTGTLAPHTLAPGVVATGALLAEGTTDGVGAWSSALPEMVQLAAILDRVQDATLAPLTADRVDRVTLLEQRTFSGRIVDADGGPVVATVQIGPRAVTTNAGAFAMRLVEGVHDLSLHVPGFDQVPLETRAGEVDVVDADLELDLVVPIAVEIDVIVLDHHGDPVEGAGVVVTGEDEEYEVSPFFVLGGEPNAVATTNAFGLGRLRAVPMRSAVVRVDDYELAVGDLRRPQVVEITLPPPPTTAVVIHAAGATGEEVLELRVAGQPVASWTVPMGAEERTFHAFEHELAGVVAIDEIEIAFVNNGRSASGGDRNLRVDRLVVDGIAHETEAPTTHSTGTWNADTGCAPGAKQSEWLHCTGVFTYSPGGEPPPPSTSVPPPVSTTTVPPTSTTLAPTTTTGGGELTVWALGATGEERFDVVVDGVVVGSFVASTDFAPFVAPVAAGQRQIEVVFTNNGTTAAGADRNLRVDAVSLAGVRYEAEDPTTFSTGTWNSSTGCASGTKESEWLHCNGAFTFVVDAGPPPTAAPTTTVAPSTTMAPTTTSVVSTTAPPTTTTTSAPPGPSTPPDGVVSIDVLAAGATGEESLALLVQGSEVARWTVAPGAARQQFSTYSVEVPGPVTPADITVAFTNDGPASDGSDRNLRVDAIVLGGLRFETEHPATVSTGTWNSSTGCAPGAKESEWLHCSGAFTFGEPAGPAPTTSAPPPPTSAPSSTTTTMAGSGSSIVIRAAGSTGEERISLELSGIVVASWTVAPGAQSRDFAEYRYDHPIPVEIGDVRVQFTNNGVSAGRLDRNVRVDYVNLDGLVFQTEAPETHSTGTWSPASGCAPGNKQLEWLHCNGELRFG